MEEKTFDTPMGVIHYWTGGAEGDPEAPTLALLPGLTADHRLFDRQVEGLRDRCRLIVWDAPGHGASRPFELGFGLPDKALWLKSILDREGAAAPVLVGQSMGGCVSQMFIHLFPGRAAAFVSIDSAPLQRRYYTAAELWLLRHIEPMYRLYPWRALLRDGARGCAESAYGRSLMRTMMEDYTPREYCRLAADGYRMLAEAVEADLPYAVSCPALLICGRQDHAGSARGYNRRWAAQTGLPIVWLAAAGHNANTDQPDWVNDLLWQTVNGEL